MPPKGSKSTRTKKEEVVRRAPGFNEVSALITPNGDLVVTLSHRATPDTDVMLRVSDVELCGMLDLNPDLEEWEDESTVIGRINHGKNWEAD